MMAEPFERKEAVVIVNPAAHNATKRKALSVANMWLREQGWKAEWAETSGAGDATTMSAKAAELRVPLVFVCGGDGTLNEAVNGLAGSDTAVSVIPAGTVNLWAREVGLLKKPSEAVRLAIAGVRRRVDLGRVGSRYFLSMASFGIDAAVVHLVPHRVKGRVGAAAYALSAARQAMTYQGSRVTLSLDGEERSARALMIVAGNTREYAGLTKVTPDAVVDDGLLDICVYEGGARWDIIRLAALTLLKRHRRSKRVDYRRARHLTIASEPPLLVQLDGEALPESPTEVSVAAGALSVMTPRDLRSPLFSRPPEPA
ncbi:MAG: diacylglycerol kinase family lipid kinase [Chloroflexi bacterium]|nr:MAG: diacylglycerol kinase family lipid kinase [Chloroflexota bacterium]